MKHTYIPNRWLKLIILSGVISFFFSPTSSAFFLTCPDDVIVTTGPNECSLPVFFDTVSFESDNQLIDTVFLPESGSIFSTGINEVVLAVTDVNGNIESCTFHIIVYGLNSFEPVCLPFVEIDLQDSCQRYVHAAEVLDLGANGCPSDFTTYRFDANGDTIAGIIDAFDVLDTIELMVFNPFTQGSCITLIAVSGGAAPAITCPADITIYCNEPIDSSHTGAPLITGCYASPVLSYTDQLTATNCPDSIAFQIHRTWTATDPFGFQTSCLQMITGMRFDVDSIVFPDNFDGVDNPVLVCNDSLSLQQLTHPNITGRPLHKGFPAKGPSSCKVAVSYDDFYEVDCGAATTIQRVWKAVQVCPPSFTLLDTQLIVVVDTQAPIFTVPDTIWLSSDTLCSDTFAFASPTVLSECSPYSTLIVTPWDTLYAGGDSTHFTPVPGTYSITWTLTDACGNAATKTSILVVGPQMLIKCPPDTTVLCDYYRDTIVPAIQSMQYESLNSLGVPLFALNCDPQLTQQAVASVNFCGVGQVTRTMSSPLTDPPLTCQQTIHVVHHSDYEVIFQADTSLCTGDLSSLPQPQVVNLTCEQIAYDFIDNIVDGELPGCYTVERQWQIKNNCIYTGINMHDDLTVGPRHLVDGGDGIVTWLQRIEVNNQSKPVFSLGCSIEDKVLPAAACELSVNWPTLQVDGCTLPVSLSISGVPGAVPGGSSQLGPGNYEVTFTATDACGNSATCATTFEIEDLTPPVIVCKTLSVELEQANPPFAEILASDFDNGSFDNCTDTLVFSFAPDTSQHTRYYFCCQQGQYPIEIWATDQAGNQSSCQTTLTITEGQAACSCGVTVSGVIRTEKNLTVRNVIVELMDANGQVLQRDTTKANGRYTFTNVTPGLSYTIVPRKNTGFLNGVTTFDQVVITRHILGVQALGSPYKIIAADANGSQTVTTFDLVGIRRLILGITNELPNGVPSWRFVPADFTFPNPDNPFLSTFPEHIEIPNLQGAIDDADFVAIKIGDVNDSVDPQL